MQEAEGIWDIELGKEEGKEKKLHRRGKQPAAVLSDSTEA